MQGVDNASQHIPADSYSSDMERAIQESMGMGGGNAGGAGGAGNEGMDAEMEMVMKMSMEMDQQAAGQQMPPANPPAEVQPNPPASQAKPAQNPDPPAEAQNNNPEPDSAI